MPIPIYGFGIGPEISFGCTTTVSGSLSVCAKHPVTIAQRSGSRSAHIKFLEYDRFTKNLHNLAKSCTTTHISYLSAVWQVLRLHERVCDVVGSVDLLGRNGQTISYWRRSQAALSNISWGSLSGQKKSLRRVDQALTTGRRA